VSLEQASNTIPTMQVMSGLDGLRALPPGTVLSVGNFDGVHRGHREILKQALSLNRQRQGRGVAVVTFEPHPLTVIRPDLAPPRLSGEARKRELLEDAGVEYLVELAPTRAVLDLAAEEFWRIIRDEVRPTDMVEGGSFNFGKDRGGTIERLRDWSAQSNVKLHVVGAVSAVLLDLTIVTVSSSLIRWLLGHGRVRDAAICLGRPYEIEGQVIHANQRGRSIGVPTANLNVITQMIPLEGVYAGACTVNGHRYPAALSIGTTPTFEKHELQVEAHLIGFNGDLYDQHIRVEIIDWVREQRKFNSIDALKAQLKQDIRTADQLAAIRPERQIAHVGSAVRTAF
jgi:riboflavin kinase / FMN adenylyltransferase